MTFPRSGRTLIGLVGLLALALGAAACTADDAEGANGAPAGSLATTGSTVFTAPEYAATAARTSAVLAQASGQSEGIWVTGAGKVSVTPDLALLSLGVEAQEATVSEAREKAATAMQGVIGALKAAGVDDRDIQTRYFNIQPNYQWDERQRKQVLDGYRVTNTVTAKIRDLSRVGDAIDGAVAAGGDETRINSVSFTAEDSAAAEAEARTKAMQDAVMHAQQLATAAGVNLGKPIFISESGGSPMTKTVRDMAFAREEAMAAAPTPIQVGELDIVITVQAVFAIA